MRLVYKCHYDGENCDKETPRLDVQGYVIEPEKSENPVTYNKGAWDVCNKCSRNHCLGGACYGKLKIE